MIEQPDIVTRIPTRISSRVVLFTEAWRDPRAWGMALLVALVVFGTYVHSLGNSFNYDDEANIIENPHYRGLGPDQLRWMFTTFHMGHYQPLSWMSLGLDYLLWRDDPFGYHLTNLLLHVANAVLVYLLALAMLADRTTDPATVTRPTWVGHLAALLAALLFANHPLRVESVVWVTERRDVLSSFFLLLAVLFYLHAHAGATVKRTGVWVTAAVVVFTLSLLSRAMGVTLPVVLLVLDWYPLRRLGGRPRGWTDRRARRVYLEKLPFLVLATGFAVVAPLAQQAAAATVSLEEHGLVARLMQACYGLVFYLWKTVVPHGLAPLYRLQTPLPVLSLKYIAPAILVVLGVVTLWKRRRQWPWLTIAALLYFVLLAPVLGFAQAGRQEVADRYSYLPAVVLTILMSAGVLRAWGASASATPVAGGPRPGGGRGASASHWSLPVAGAAVLAVALLSVLTWRQSLVWRTPESLWHHTVRYAPSATAHQNLAAVLAQQGRLHESIEQSRLALQYEPLHERALRALAKALTDTKQYAEARPVWELILEHQAEDVEVRFQYANTLLALNRPLDAIAQYRETLRLNPELPGAHVNLGQLLLAQDREDEAIMHFRRALRSQPDHPDAHYNLGTVLMRRGEHELAADAFRLALAARPGFPEAATNLAITLARLERLTEAEQIYREVLRADPDHGVARYNLARLLAESGRREEALAELREMLRRNPRDDLARRALQALGAAPSPGG